MKSEFSESWPDWLRRAEVALQAAGVDDAAGKLRYVAGTLLGCGPGAVESVARQAETASPDLAARREEMLSALLAGTPAQWQARRISLILRSKRTKEC